MYENLRVWVVVPAHNEERLIDTVLDGMPPTVDRIIGEDFADQTDIDAATSALLLWRANHAMLEPTLRASPGLTEMLPMSQNLRDVAMIGLEALRVGSSDTKPGADWLDPRLQRLQEARKPEGQTELMIVDPVVDLVCAVALPASLTAEGCREEEAAAPVQH